MADLDGVESVLGYTRIPQYRDSPNLSVEEYAAKKHASGLSFDRVLSFHVRNDAEIIAPVEGGREEDADSFGYSVLLSYDRKLKRISEDQPNRS